MRYFKKLVKILFLITIGLLLSEVLLLLIKIKTIEERDFIEYPDKKIILCIGDSYTFGGEVENKDSYPSLLSEMIKEKGFTAVNLGICEADTSTISEKYINFLKNKKPEKVIFLGGSANLFGYKSPNKFFFENLRTYKLLRIFFINLKSWVLSEKSKKEIYANHIPFEIDLYKNYPANSENYYTQKTISLLFEKRNFKQAYEAAIEGLEKFPESINLLWLTANLNFKLNNIKESEKNIKKISEFAYKSTDLNDSSLNAKGIILRGLAEWDIINYKFDKATGKIIQALKYMKKLTKYDIYVIKQTFLMQSSLSADNIYEELIEISKTNSEIAEDKNFKKLIEYFKNFKKNESQVLNWIESDIRKIINISKKIRIELYIMTYPYPYTKVNDLIRNVSQKNKIKIIDAEKYFAELGESDKSLYFKDTDHLSAQGNLYLSKIIYNRIFENK
ncbi:MAG: hypothetical protein N2Z60_05110 [Elusimicrobiales bacterium]|nr:hypothetical protein [Elusimicrobiales bacterium]